MPFFFCNSHVVKILLASGIWIGKVIGCQQGFWTSIPIPPHTNIHAQKLIHTFANANLSVYTPWVTSNRHILPKGCAFIKAVTFQHPAPPPSPTPTPYILTHTHAFSPWHSCTHHEHGNTHDAGVQVMHEWEEKSWGNYLPDMAGERAIKAWGCGKVVRDVHVLHPRRRDTAGGV